MTAEREQVAAFLRAIGAINDGDPRSVVQQKSLLLRGAELLLTCDDLKESPDPKPETRHEPLRLRRILPLDCASCGHRWIAPTKGACPKCHSENTNQQGDERTETASRV